MAAELLNMDIAALTGQITANTQALFGFSVPIHLTS
jgi:hypothetical protein